MNRKLLLVVAAFLSYFVFGFSDNLKGPLLPEILHFFNINYSIGSNILLLSYLGFMIATLIMGPLSDRRDNRFIMIFVSTIILLGLGGTGVAKVPQFIYLSYFILGFGLGSTAIVANALIVEKFPKNSGFFLNILSFFHGLGAMTAPIVAGKLLSNGVKWSNIYLLMTILPSTLFLLFLISSSGEKKIKEVKEKQGSLFSTFTPEVVLFIISITMYVAAELGISSWIVEYMEKQVGLSVIKSSLFLSLYYGLLMVGRLIGSTIVDRVGHIKILRITSILAFTTLSLGVIFSKELAILIPVTGLFFSIIFPTTVASASERNSHIKGQVFGVLFFFSGVGGMLGPWAIGQLANIYGMGIALMITPIFLSILVVSLFLIGRKDRV